MRAAWYVRSGLSGRTSLRRLRVRSGGRAQQVGHDFRRRSLRRDGQQRIARGLHHALQQVQVARARECRHELLARRLASSRDGGAQLRQVALQVRIVGGQARRAARRDRAPRRAGRRASAAHRPARFPMARRSAARRCRCLPAAGALPPASDARPRPLPAASAHRSPSAVACRWPWRSERLRQLAPADLVSAPPRPAPPRPAVPAPGRTWGPARSGWRRHAASATTIGWSWLRRGAAALKLQLAEPADDALAVQHRDVVLDEVGQSACRPRPRAANAGDAC